jgi:flagellar hook protein FlgE
MGLIQALASAPRLRQFAGAATLDLSDDFRAHEPELGLSWTDDEAEAIESDEAAAYAANAVFLVCEQKSLTSRGEPVFGKPFASNDDNLALSEDGYLINGGGHFLLGLPLDEDGNRIGHEPKVVRLDAKGIETVGTSRIAYRGNLPAYPLTANADFDEAGSELLDRTLFARDPSVQGSGIVLGDERLKFLDRSLAGGSVRLISPDGRPVDLVLRWAKMTSLRSAGRECWNLFYRVRRDARSGEVAWKNCGHAFVFSADGRLEEASLVVPVMDLIIDGVRLGNVSVIFGAGGITQFADRTGLVKILRAEADGCAGGEFTGISMSSRGRLFAHYSNSEMRPLADIQFSGEETWFEASGEDWRELGKKRVA